MKKKIKVGRRFFKYEIPEDELPRIKAGRPLNSIGTPDQAGFTIEWFTEEWIKGLKNHMKEFLYFSTGLTPEPIVYRSKISETDPEAWPTEDEFRPEDGLRKGITLEDYVLFLGYEHDSLEHLAAKIFCLISVLEWVNNGKEQDPIEDLFHNLVWISFELGRAYALFVTYQNLNRDNSRGGKNKTNPWQEYGYQLLERYPHKSQRQIWWKIPKGRSLQEDGVNRIEDAEPDTPDVCGGFRFYRIIEENKEIVVAKDDKTGKVTAQNTFNSFRKNYLKKFPF